MPGVDKRIWAAQKNPKSGQMQREGEKKKEPKDQPTIGLDAAKSTRKTPSCDSRRTREGGEVQAVGINYHNNPGGESRKE